MNNIALKKGDLVNYIATGAHAGVVTADSSTDMKMVSLRVGNVYSSYNKTMLTKVYKAYKKGERVEVRLISIPASFYFATIAEDSPVTDEMVKVKEFDTSVNTISKDRIAIPTATPAAVNEVFWLNARVSFSTTPSGQKELGTVSAYSPSTTSLVSVQDSKGIIHYLDKKLVTKYIATVKKDYFTDLKKPTDDEKLMAKLFQATTHDAVVALGIKGLDLTKYDVVQDAEWFFAIPKRLKKDDKVPCFIAHTDLHPNLKHPTKDNLEYTAGIFKSSTGLGADDRAGVFAINALLQTNPEEFMFLFPDKEEVGLIGSKAFSISPSFKLANKHASMFVSIDRRREYNGDKTLATYGYDDNKLNKWVSEITKRKIVKGSSTDCRALSMKSSNEVPCFNLSCGYTAEHTVNETLRFNELLETIGDLELLLGDDRCLDTYKAEVETYTYLKKSSGKKKASIGSYGLQGLYDDEFSMIEVNGDWFMPEDVETLLENYKYFNGVEYDSSNAYMIPEVSTGDFVRLKQDLVVGHKYGGVLLPQDIANGMLGTAWEIEAIDKQGKIDLISLAKNSVATVSKVPRCWLEIITEDDPIVIQ